MGEGKEMVADHNDNSSRTVLIKRNIVASFLIKGWSAVVLLLLVPITLKCLGEYTNGVWLTISSMLVWIDQMDIGLGRGLQNKLATALAKNDIPLAKRMVSNTFFMLVCIIVPVLFVLNLLVACGDVYAFLNVNKALVPDLQRSVCVAVSLVCGTFIFKFIGNFYMGLQLPAVSNLLVVLGQTLSLGLTYLLYLSGEGSLLYVVLINTLSPLVVYLIAFPYTFCHRYREMSPSFSLFEFREALHLFEMGLKFFAIQFFGVVVMMSSNVMISRYVSPEVVTPYQVVYRYFSLLLVAFSVISVPYWSATTDAYQRGDMAWIRNSVKRMRLVLLAFVLMVCVMVLVSPFVFRIWVGDLTHIPYELVVVVAIYFVVVIVSQSYSNFLNGFGFLYMQAAYAIVMLVLYVPMVYAVMMVAGRSVYVILSVMIMILFVGLIINRVQLYGILTGKGGKYCFKP